jgi:hypothetical protein
VSELLLIFFAFAAVVFGVLYVREKLTTTPMRIAAMAGS